MKRSVYVFGGLAGVSMIVALVAFAGITMVGSLSTPETQARDSREVVIWGAVCLTGLVLSVAFSLAAWKHHRRRVTHPTEIRRG